MPVYEFTDEFAQMRPPPPEIQQLFGAMHGNQEAMDAFVSVQANTMPAPEFSAPENLAQISRRGAPSVSAGARASWRLAPSGRAVTSRQQSVSSSRS